MASRIRTFVAIELSPEVTGAAGRVIGRLSGLATGYRWVRTDSLHVTLSFLGQVDESEVPTICRLVKTAIESTPAFSISFRHLGAFPAVEKPRTVWIGVEEGKEELCQLQDVTQSCLVELGYPKDRHQYRPHLTLGRINRGAKYSQAVTDEVVRCADQFFGDSYVDEVIVFSSYLDKSGPTYTPMSRIELKE